jgi:hypothetical protein
VLIIVVASAAALAVTVWTFYSVTNTKHHRGTPASFRE